MLKKNIFLKILEYVLIIFLAIVLAFSYMLFVVKNNFAPAGINGIAVMIQYKFGFSIGYMSLLINIPLCIFSFFAIDRKFAIKTFLFCIVYSSVYLLLQKIDLSSFQYNANDIDTIFPVMISGLVSGSVTGILFKVQATTGGTDIISKYISKKYPSVNFFWITFAINTVVAISSFFVYAKEISGEIVYDYKPVCLCILYCFFSSFIANKLIKGSRQAYEFVIITENSKEIEDEIISKLKHSATKIVGEGIYSGKSKDVLICIINKHQLIDFEKIIKKYPSTFAFVGNVNEAIGNFKKIK